MVLDKLASALKKTTDKIANAILLDQKAVDGIIRDLQRALIEADVNVALVMELSQKLKKIAYDERIKGIEKKEHLIKALHDELVRILGQKREIVLGKKNIFMLVGLYGSGKCVHGESNIQFSDGDIIKIKEAYNNLSKRLPEDKLEDGAIINLSQENIFVPSFNPQTAKIENKKVSHIWKLNKKELFEIYLDNGNDYSVKVTPEHPFFVLREGNISKVRADQIRDSDYIAIPREAVIEGRTQYLLDDIKKLNLFVYLTPEEARICLNLKDKLLKEIHKNLKYKENYCKFTSNVKRGKIPIEFLEDMKRSSILIKGKNDTKVISLPLYLTNEFSEFLGYLMGDGNIRESYVQMSSEDIEVINRFVELSRILFGIDPIVKRAIRTNKMYDIRVCSSTLVKALSIFGLKPGKKGKNLKIPSQVLKSNNEVVRMFIRAYFDCDSYAAKNTRLIELVSESQILIKQMNLLLKRFGIVSSISNKLISEVGYWRLIIKARYAERYAERIGYLIKRKQKIADEYHKFGLIQGCGNQDMIPLGKALKELRQMLGFSIGEIQSNAVYSYGRYEQSGLISRDKLQKLVDYYKMRKKGIFFDFLNDLKSNTVTREKYSTPFINGAISDLKSKRFVDKDENLKLLEAGDLYLERISESTKEASQLLEVFESISNSNVCWLPIKKINPITNDEDFVYDLTVDGNHSFIAEGIIVHNTTTIGKLASYYAKRGQKVCAVGLDVHRPAAALQLKQVCEKVNVPTFVDAGEKSALKIWKKFEKEIEEYSLVLVDTAGRDALDNELIDEIKDIGKAVKPTECFLVIPADIGQTAKKQAQAFKEAVNVTGVFITRMDSTAKAGGALTACAEVGAPVVFIGTGEKLGDIEQFNPESFLSRLLGMGDLQSLMEKVQSAMGKEGIEKTQKRLEEGKFTLKDFQQQLGSMQEMGSFDSLLSMVPGMGKVKEKISSEQLEAQQDKVKHWKYAIDSMTPEETENPELLEKQTSRIQRVAHGSGATTAEIRALLKQYKMLKDMVGSQSILEGGNLDQKTLMKFAKKYARKMKF
ncbi:MAG: LAGLIDADG family homing endonuclease [Nanoarchaeota archaeon]|nr:LAGLIDADG family homing endonuclease [Nanoarchaeota archaeon]